MNYIYEAMESSLKWYATLLLLGIVLFPLGLWKLVEIIIWVIHHVHVGIN